MQPKSNPAQIRRGGPRVKPLADRLWSRVDRTDRSAEECHPWIGPLARNGYGYLGRGMRNGKHVLAHRLAWELTYGPIPEGLVVCHRCDNRRCCNPMHLFIGTMKDDIHDMWAKGRQSPPPHTPGRRGAGAKLSNDQVRTVRRRSAGGELQRVLAGEFGVTQKVISLILLGRTYRDVD